MASGLKNPARVHKIKSRVLMRMSKTLASKGIGGTTFGVFFSPGRYPP